MWIMSQDKQKYISVNIKDGSCNFRILQSNEDENDCKYIIIIYSRDNYDKIGYYSSLSKAKVVLRQLANAIQRREKEFIMLDEEDL